MTSTAVPPRPKTMTGPKVGSSAIPAINSRALGRRIIGWMVTPVMRASGLRRARPRQNVGDRLAHRALAGEIEPDAADFGFVHDVAARGFWQRRPDPCVEKRSRDGSGFIGIAGEQRGRDRNGVGRKQARDSRSDQARCGPRSQRASRR